MKAQFALALGLSAVDTLLSAFTALLLLALVFISPQVNRRAGLAGNVSVLMIEKTAEAKEAMTARLLVEIQNPAQPIGVAQLNEREGLRVVNARGSGTLFAAPAGQAAWSDCASTTSSTCFARLIISQPAATWAIRLRIAESEEPTTVLTHKLVIKARLLGSGVSAPCRKELVPGGQVVFQLGFGAHPGLPCTG